MKLRYILFGLVMILSLSACEKEIVLTDEHRTDRLTINAIVNPDTVVYAYVTEANDIDYFKYSRDLISKLAECLEDNHPTVKQEGK